MEYHPPLRLRPGILCKCALTGELIVVVEDEIYTLELPGMR